MRKNKKVVLLIVEGISDKKSLELPLKLLVSEDNQLEFEIVEGDITSEYDTKSSNIKSKLGNLVKDGKVRKFQSKDYKEAVHIIDLDGVYLKDEFLLEEAGLSNFKYSETSISAKNRELILERNKKKREIIDILLRIPKVYKSVPYRVFFFSGNLEHVLHNIIDVDDGEKQKLANEFQDKYVDSSGIIDLEGFIDFMCKSNFSSGRGYKESWDYIKQIDDRILRFTNFDVFIREYR